MKLTILFFIICAILCEAKEHHDDNAKDARSRTDLLQKILDLKTELKRLQAETDAAAKVRDFKKAAKLDADSAIVVNQIASLEAELKDVVSELPSDSSKVAKQVMENCYRTTMAKINSIGGWESTFKIINTFIGAAAEFGIATIEIRALSCSGGEVIAISPSKSGEVKTADFTCTPDTPYFCLTLGRSVFSINGGSVDSLQKRKTDYSAKKTTFSKYVVSVQDIFSTAEVSKAVTALCSSAGRSYIAWHLLGRGFDVDLDLLLGGRLIIDLWSPLSNANNQVKMIGSEIQGGYIQGTDLTFMDLIIFHSPMGCRFTLD
jgi:hypothetical protein